MASDKLQETDNLDGFTDGGANKNLRLFNIETFIFTWRRPLVFIVLGVILIGLGVIFYRLSQTDDSSIEVSESFSNESNTNSEIVVEISGEIEKPGVYKLSNDSRVEDLLIAGGGISVNADRDWVEKYINRAAKLTDGQKIFIPSQNERVKEQESVSNQSNSGSAKNNQEIKVDQGVFGSGSENLVNINTAGFQELDTLPGIGQVYAQSIIEHRPYSNVEELVSKGALKKNVYEKIKDKITIY